MTCGIYLLRFNNTSKVYIGQSLHIEKRFIDHCYKLKVGQGSKALQKAYEEYGKPNLELLCECIEEELNMYEEEAIQIFNSVKNGFNTKDSFGHRTNICGELATLTTISNNQAVNIMFMLLDPSNKFDSISTSLNVSINVVKDISCGNSHYWLNTQYPKEYAELMGLKGARSTGENNSVAKYSNAQIEQVLKLLLTDNTYEYISKKLGIHISTIKSIANGRGHTWLKEVCPDMYKQLGSRKVESRSAKSQGKDYPEIKSPTGEVFNVENIKAFAREHNLNDGHLGAVLRGKEGQHKGWKLVQV